MSLHRSPVRAACAAGSAFLVLTAANGALAWGASGHRLIGQAAMLALPSDLPGFVRTPAAVEIVGEGAREPDRSKGGGQPHDHDLDPGHFLDLDDAGRVNGGPALSDLPTDREAFDTALRAAGSDEYKAGYLPYNIEDGFEQLAKDFAYWRVETAALKTTADAKDRAWIARDRAEREQLTLRDIGYWAHFVGDGSQPLHVTVHYNGWGGFPNPKGYTTDKIHGPFEGDFVHAHVTLPLVQAAMRPLQPCEPIQACTAGYLTATGAHVEPLYAMWGQGGFTRGDAPAVAFTVARVADGASELRDMIVAAWKASGQVTIGYQPEISVQAAEAGQVVPMQILYGKD